MRYLIVLFTLLVTSPAIAQGYYAAASEQNFYHLVPEDYGITQGTTDSIACLTNRLQFEKAMEDAKEAGYIGMQVSDDFDAYFDTETIQYPLGLQTGVLYDWWEAINIPSNFILNLGKANMRVRPNGAKRNSLFSSWHADNSMLIGGIYWGDRNKHDFTRDDSSHEWGHLINIKACTNFTVVGAETHLANGDGIVLSARYHQFQSNYRTSLNTRVVNCQLLDHRRQGISITASQNAIIERCYFANNGRNTESSTGAHPMTGIDIEATRYRNDEGEIVPYEVANNTIIRNNVETNSAVAGFIIAIGENTEIYGNQVGSGIVWNQADTLHIHDNYLVKDNFSTTGIKGGSVGGTSDNVLVENNKIEGYEIAMMLSSKGVTARYNTATNFESGLWIYDAEDMEIYGNSFIGNSTSSKAMNNRVGTVDKISIHDNTFTAPDYSGSFIVINKANSESAYGMKLTKNIFRGGKLNFDRSSGIIFEDNDIYVTTDIDDSTDLQFLYNRIEAGGDPGFYFRDAESQDINIIGNSINTSWTPLRTGIAPQNLIYRDNTVNGSPQSN